MIKRPMLAGKLKKRTEYTFPLFGTLKYDGIRSFIEDSCAYSRKMKEIPNRHVQAEMRKLPRGLDGEIMVPGKTFHEIQSAIMSEDGEPDFEFFIFDYVKDDLEKPYDERLKDLQALELPDWCIKVMPEVLNDLQDLNDYEEFAVSNGYEGIMVRDPKGPYKEGRSTENEGYLLKIKRFEDSEVVILGFEEEMENQNESTTDELGLSKRAKKKEFMVPKNTLGKFVVKEIGDVPWKGQEFRIGTGEGLTQKLRKEIWDNQANYLGKIITYKYQPYGVKDLPRIPIFKGIRDERDMS